MKVNSIKPKKSIYRGSVQVEITQEFLRDRFEYRDGSLFYRKNIYQGKNIGKKAGTIYKGIPGKREAHEVVSVNHRSLKASRLIFLYHHGYLPTVVDHIDGNPVNNKIENLRAATYFNNSGNRKISKNNTSGFKGISKSRSKWIAQICVNRKTIQLGQYETPEEAHQAYMKAAKKYFGEFATDGKRDQAMKARGLK